MDSLETFVNIADKVSGGDPLLFVLAILAIASIAAMVAIWGVGRKDATSYRADIKEVNDAFREILKSNVETLQALDHHLDTVRAEVPRMSREVRDKIEDSEHSLKSHISNETNRIIGSGK